MSFPGFIKKLLFCTLLICFSGCRTNTDSQQDSTRLKADKEEASRKISGENGSTESRHSLQKANTDIPEKVYTVLDYIRKYNKAPDGYAGGRKFGNYEKRLPLKDANGKPMKYREWDVNPKEEGKNRGAERLITSEIRRAWYTKDHYESFTEIE